MRQRRRGCLCNWKKKHLLLSRGWFHYMWPQKIKEHLELAEEEQLYAMDGNNGDDEENKHLFSDQTVEGVISWDWLLFDNQSTMDKMVNGCTWKKKQCRVHIYRSLGNIWLCFHVVQPPWDCKPPITQESWRHKRLPTVRTGAGYSRSTHKMWWPKVSYTPVITTTLASLRQTMPWSC